MWEVEYTNEFQVWWESLLEAQQDAIAAAIEILEEKGPALGRPLVDSITSSRHRNMKELRPGTTNSLRVLFAFDPRRSAILLTSGGKTGRWRTWYEEFIPIADKLYDDHLRELREEGVI